jgi:hypothetical protein
MFNPIDSNDRIASRNAKTLQYLEGWETGAIAFVNWDSLGNFHALEIFKESRVKYVSLIFSRGNWANT